MAEISPQNPSQQAVARVLDPLPVPQVCPHCLAPVEVVRNGEIYGSDYGNWPWAYACQRRCSFVGMHPFTDIPLGTLATKPIRAARKRAKTAFNPLWQGRAGQSGALTRSQAYGWLAEQLGIPAGACHIGWLDVAACDRVVAVCRERAA